MDLVVIESNYTDSLTEGRAFVYNNTLDSTTNIPPLSSSFYSFPNLTITGTNAGGKFGSYLVY